MSKPPHNDYASYDKVLHVAYQMSATTCSDKLKESDVINNEIWWHIHHLLSYSLLLLMLLHLTYVRELLLPIVIYLS